MGSVNCENNTSPSFHGKELGVDYKKADQPVLVSLFIKSGIAVRFHLLKENASDYYANYR